MQHREENEFPSELHDVAERLRHERAEATPLELDRMKLMAMKRAARPGPTRGTRARSARSRFASPILAAALLLAGAAAIVGNTSGTPISLGGSNASSSSSQYCPDTSQQPGKPKDPGPSVCGKPKTK